MWIRFLKNWAVKAKLEMGSILKQSIVCKADLSAAGLFSAVQIRVCGRLKLCLLVCCFRVGAGSGPFIVAVLLAVTRGDSKQHN